MDKIKLYHYSDYDFKGYIRPGYFGRNSYSRNSERISDINRSYFYLKRNCREYYLNGCRFLYIAEISRDKIYNLNKDPLKLTDKSRDIFRAVKSRGFKGLIGSNGYPAGVLFYPVKIKSREALTK